MLDGPVTRLTVDLAGHPGPVVVHGAGTPQSVHVLGYDRGDLVAAPTFIRNGPTPELRTTFTP